MARSLNCVQLIGNLTRDPELRSTQSGNPVCDIGLATNRQWKTESGQQKENTEFHKLVLWGKLAEISSQYLKKGAKAYFQGRLTTRAWTAQDGTQKNTTEIIVEEMIMLSGEPRTGGPGASTGEKPAPQTKSTPAQQPESTPAASTKGIEVDTDEIPF